MPSHLSIGTALDKNRLNTNVVYLVLLEVDIIDPNTGNVTQTIYVTQNNESFTWMGHTYQPMSFSISAEFDNQQVPTCTVTVQDLAQVFQAQLQAYGWSIAWPVRFKVVNATTPTQVPEIEFDYVIMEAICKDDTYAIDFTLGAENPLALRFPTRQQFDDQCFWQYKDPNSCAYTGTLTTCDFTWDGTNGCLAHDNIANFGGFPGLRQTS